MRLKPAGYLGHVSTEGWFKTSSTYCLARHPGNAQVQEAAPTLCAYDSLGYCSSTPETHSTATLFRQALR